MFFVTGTMIRMGDIPKRHLQQFFFCIAGHCYPGRVDRKEPEPGCDQGHAQRAVLEDLPEPLLALAKCLFGLLASGDIPDNRAQAGRLSFIVPEKERV